MQVTVIAAMSFKCRPMHKRRYTLSAQRERRDVTTFKFTGGLGIRAVLRQLETQ